MLRYCARSLFSQLIFSPKSKLKLHNSETLALSINVSNDVGASSVETVTMPRAGTIDDLRNSLSEKFNLTDIVFMCNERLPLHEGTPVQILLNRYFYLFSKQSNIVQIEGELFDQDVPDPIIEGLSSLQLPIQTKSEMEKYFKRVNQWVAYKTGKSITDPEMRISSAQARDIFIEAVVDPVPQSRDILEKQELWHQWYWRVQDLKKKKREADQACLKKVKQRMSVGLIALASNIAFIWSGTYIFFSWDIIEPVAYFITSFGAIVLTSRFFRLGRPYSNFAYQEYLHKKLAPEFYKNAGFSEEELIEAQYQLLELESVIKDHILKKL